MLTLASFARRQPALLLEHNSLPIHYNPVNHPYAVRGISERSPTRSRYHPTWAGAARAERREEQYVRTQLCEMEFAAIPETWDQA